MEVTKPCVSCGGFDILVDKLDMDVYINWFVKCKNCIGVTTVTHAVKEMAIAQWNEQWVWNEITTLKKRAEVAEDKVHQLRLNRVEDKAVLQFRYEKIVDEYVKYRMLYSGTAGNINLDERKSLMKKEISAELGWTI